MPRILAAAARIVLISCILAVSMGSGAAESCRRGFETADSIATARTSNSAVYGDFNSDGRVDLAAMDSFYDLVVSLNRGGRIFEIASVERSSIHARLLAATDADRDGHIDLVLKRDRLYVRRGRGDGTFGEVEEAGPGAAPSEWKPFDVDRDGVLDFVIYGRDEIVFQRSVGDGTFVETARGRLPELNGLSERSHAIGDFDGDGSIDLLRSALHQLTKQWILSVLWNVAGPQSDQHEVVSLNMSVGVTAVDVDGDGTDEILASGDDGVTLIRLRQRRIETDANTSAALIPVTMRDAAIFDADADGYRDLVFLHGGLAIARGTPDGRFSEPVAFYFHGAPGFVLVDLDGDGLQDIAATGGGSVAYGTDARRFPTRRLYTLGVQGLIRDFIPRELEIADLNGDGLLDVVAVDQSSLTFAPLFGDGAGTFRRGSMKRFFGREYVVTQAAVGDFDGDGAADLAIGDSRASVKPIVTFGDGDGDFAGTLMLQESALVGTLTTAGRQRSSLLIARGEDVQVVDVTAGRTAVATTIFTRPQSAPMFVLDADADGTSEIAIIIDGRLEIRRLGNGQWETIASLPTWPPVAIAVADLNSDLLPDLVVADDTGANVYLREGVAYRLLTYINETSIRNLVASDVDGDGLPDLVISLLSSGIVVLRNGGDGRFTSYSSSVSRLSFPGDGALADLDGDGREELLLATTYGVEVLETSCLPPPVRAMALPAVVQEGARVRLIVNTVHVGKSYGTVTIRNGSTFVSSDQLGHRLVSGTMTWTTQPLPRGTHRYIIEYTDGHGITWSTTVTVNVGVTPKRRAVRQ